MFIAVASFCSHVSGLPSTFAAAVVVTVPVDIVNPFPVTEILASAETTAVPAKRQWTACGFKLASPDMDNVPRPSIRGLPETFSTIESAVIPIPLIVNVNDVLVTVIVTFLSSAAVAMETLENALILT